MVDEMEKAGSSDLRAHGSFVKTWMFPTIRQMHSGGGCGRDSTHRVLLVLQPVPEGFVASSPDLPGLAVRASARDEAEKCLRAAIHACARHPATAVLLPVFRSGGFDEYLLFSALNRVRSAARSPGSR
jgi:hypothetical protein